MKLKLELSEKYVPYKGVISFLIIMLVAHFFWKLTMKGDESDMIVTFFGLDLSKPFNAAARHVAQVCAYLLQFFGSSVDLVNHNSLIYPNGVGVRVVWACTGLKQAYIFFCIMLFSTGPWQKKLWFIPLGLLMVYVFNILRIAGITALIENHPSWFEFLHERLFKYLFYAAIFGMWVLWEEKIRKPLAVK